MTELSRALAAPGVDALFPMVMRGAVSHTRLPVTTGGASNISRGAVTIHSCPYPFRYIQIAAPWCMMGSANAPDAPFAADALVQCAIEYPLVSSMTGLAARVPFTSKLDGSESFRTVDATIVGAGGQKYATESVILDMGLVVPANSPFRLFTSFEWASGTSPGASTLPAGPFVGSSAFANIYERQFTQGTSLAASSWAKTAARPGTITTTPIQGYVPIVRVGLTPGLVAPLILGSSTGFGTGEGYAGSAGLGDFRGNAAGYSGFLERWMFGKLGIGCSNISIGADRLNYRTTVANTAFRLEMAAWLNPTCLIIQGYPNDVSDGRTSAQIQADIKMCAGLYRSAIGRQLPYHLVTCTPSSSSTNAWTAIDGSDQTVNGNRGPGSIAAQISDAIRSRSSDLGHRSCIDLADVWMSARNSGIWRGTGVANGYAGDGSHGNSLAHLQAADAFGTFNPFVDA